MAAEEFRTADKYPPDALAVAGDRADVIDVTTMDSIPAAFRERCRRTPDRPAYRQWTDGRWKTWSWGEVDEGIRRWQGALAAEGLSPGDRVAIQLHNCIEWILFDQGAMANGLVVVPVFAEDRADNIAYILQKTDARLLLLGSLEQWRELAPELGKNDPLGRVVVLAADDAIRKENDARVLALDPWLERSAESSGAAPGRNDLATIVFTSGTTGRPKGVMLSHANILDNAHAGLKCFVVLPQDRMLSFLPLSHMFERTIGCYVNVLTGSSVAFARSIPQLLDDMSIIKPTVLITVPRIFERAYDRIRSQLEEGSGLRRRLFELAVETGWQRFLIRQGRASWSVGQLLSPLLDRLVGRKVRDRFGGELRVVVSGGAPLAPRISRVFIGLGVNILQGYGLTEASPVVSVNTLEKNKPESIGLPVIGTRVRITAEGELQVSGPGVMQGYWRDPEATRETITPDGWLRSGDIAGIDGDGFIRITGRTKEIIVLANGEKVPPADMESAICDDPVFEQCLVVGEGKPFLSLIAVVNRENWQRETGMGEIDHDSAEKWAIDRVAILVRDFPGYANIYRVTLTDEPWTVENGVLTPTLKIKRPVLRDRFRGDIERMYEGH